MTNMIGAIAQQIAHNACIVADRIDMAVGTNYAQSQFSVLSSDIGRLALKSAATAITMTQDVNNGQQQLPYGLQSAWGDLYLQDGQITYLAACLADIGAHKSAACATAMLSETGHKAQWQQVSASPCLSFRRRFSGLILSGVAETTIPLTIAATLWQAAMGEVIESYAPGLHERLGLPEQTHAQTRAVIAMQTLQTAKEEIGLSVSSNTMKSAMIRYLGELRHAHQHITHMAMGIPQLPGRDHHRFFAGNTSSCAY